MLLSLVAVCAVASNLLVRRMRLGIRRSRCASGRFGRVLRTWRHAEYSIADALQNSLDLPP
jgi:hypothetical protein